MYTDLVCPDCGELIQVFRSHHWNYLPDSNEYRCSSCPGIWHVFIYPFKNPIIINERLHRDKTSLEKWLTLEVQRKLFFST